MKGIAGFVSGTLLLASSLIAHADVVALANGDRLSGAVTAVSGGTLQLTTEHLGDLVIPMEQVASVEKTEPMKIVTADKAELTGVLTTQAGQQYLRTNTGMQPIALVNIAEVAAIDPWPIWTSNLDFGYVLSKGNSDTESISLHLDSNVVNEATEHRMFVYWNRDEAEQVLTRDTFDAGYDYRWYFRDKWYALGTVGYFKDELKDIDYRVTVGAGVGYQFFSHELATLSTELGISQVFEKLDGDSESNPAVRWAVDYTRWLSPDRVDYFYGHEVLKILDSSRGEIFKANTGIRFHLSDLWTANARVDMIHETKPPEGSHKTDLVYSVGVGVVF